MKILILALLMFLFFGISLAQFNNNWLMSLGNGTGIFANENISFTNGYPIISQLITYNRMSTSSTCISDSNSNLLFYTYSINVYDSIGDTMLNGIGLSPSFWTSTNWNKGLDLTQAIITIP